MLAPCHAFALQLAEILHCMLLSYATWLFCAMLYCVFVPPHALYHLDVSLVYNGLFIIVDGLIVV